MSTATMERPAAVAVVGFARPGHDRTPAGSAADMPDDFSQEALDEAQAMASAALAAFEDELPVVESMQNAWLRVAASYSQLSREDYYLLAQARDAGTRSSPVCRCCDSPVNALVNHSLRIIPYAARRYAGRLATTDLTLEDLWQYGVFGLMTAAKRFDWRRGNSFSTVAVSWIWQSIGRNMIDHGQFVREPAHVHDKRNKARRAGEEVRGPTRPTSLNRPIHPHDADSGEIGDLIPDDDAPRTDEQVESGVRALAVAEMMRSAHLTPREALALTLRAGLNGKERLTLLETGRELGVTRERARQLELAALRKLRLLARDGGEQVAQWRDLLAG